jgi:hypothetical protein
MKRQQKVEELKKSGSGTKITAETLAAWQEKKRLKRQAEAKKLVEAELRKKKGGKGLGVLSGRALYEYKKELFKDRDAMPTKNRYHQQTARILKSRKICFSKATMMTWTTWKTRGSRILQSLNPVRIANTNKPAVRQL